MMSRYKLAAAIALGSALLATAHERAEARIACDGNFQIVNGYPVSSPYCRDLTLTRVARSYGMRVSFDAIRYSDSVKSQVCRTIGYDNRVYEACAPYRMDGDFGRSRR